MSTKYTFSGKAVSVAQPWASAITFAGKNIENRSRRTHYRGPIAIHASGKFWPEDLGYLQRIVRGGEKRPLSDWIDRGCKAFGLEPEEKLIRGHVIAIAMLVDCIDRSSSPWFRGKWGWVVEGVIPIERVPMKGARGLWPCKCKYQPLIPVK